MIGLTSETLTLLRLKY